MWQLHCSCTVLLGVAASAAAYLGDFSRRNAQAMQVHVSDVWVHLRREEVLGVVDSEDGVVKVVRLHARLQQHGLSAQPNFAQASVRHADDVLGAA